MARGKVKLNKREALLKNIYFNATRGGSFFGQEGLFRAALKANKNKRIKLTRDDVREFLSNNDIHTLHKPVKRLFKRRRVIMGRPWTQWQCDLIDFRAFKDDNKAGWVLMCIDVFTKMAFAEPVLTKSNEDIIAGFNRLLSRVPKEQWPEKIQSDKGREFLGTKVQNWAKSKGFKWFTSQDFLKASIIERLILTIKRKIQKMFMFRNNTKWEDILPSVIMGYNKSYHSSIKLDPESANTDDPQVVATVYENLYGPKSRLNSGLKSEVLRPAGQKVPLDSKIRLARYKHIFEKGYMPNFTDEIFQVGNVLGTIPQVYNAWGLKDEDDKILGTFYPSEIQRVGSEAKRQRYFKHARN